MGGLRKFVRRLSTRLKLPLSTTQLGRDADHAQSVLNALPMGDRRREAWIDRLWHLLCARYGDDGSSDTLDQIIQLEQELVTLRPKPHSQRGDALLRLAESLKTRYYHHNGLPLDFSRAIELEKEALGLLPSGHPARMDTLGHLITSFMDRYNEGGSLDDMSEVIDYMRQTLSLLVNNDPRKSLLMIDLANWLHTRHRQQLDHGDISEAIELERQIIASTSIADPSHTSAVESLISSLHLRYDELGLVEDISEAIELERGVLSTASARGQALGELRINLAGSLVQRYKSEEALPDLNEAIELQKKALTEQDGADRARVLLDLGVALNMRFDRSGSITDLDAAVGFEREALAYFPKGDEDRGPILINLSVSLSARYKKASAMYDLNSAIDLMEESLSYFSADHPVRCKALLNLGVALKDRYQALNARRDLSRAIELETEALSICAEGHPNHGDCLDNLAVSLMMRFKNEATVADVNVALELRRLALSLISEPTIDRAVHIVNVSDTLRIRYRSEGVEADLSEAIKLDRETLTILPKDHQLHPEVIGRLAGSLLNRFDTKGAISDLTEAIELLEAASSAPIPHLQANQNHINRLFILSVAFGARYNRMGAIADLNTAIERQQEVLKLQPPDYHFRDRVLHRLGANLAVRFRRGKRFDDLDEALNYLGEALALRPAGHPDRAETLLNLTTAHNSRYQRDGDMQDLDSAIKYGEEAVDLYLPGHPSRGAALIALAMPLLSRIAVESDASLTDKAMILLEECATSISVSPFSRLHASTLWFTQAEALDHRSTVAAFKAVMINLKLRATLDSLYNVRHTRGTTNEVESRKSLPLDMAWRALKESGPEAAIETLELGRSVMLSGVSRYRADALGVDNLDSSIAEKLSHISMHLESFVISSYDVGDPDTAFEDRVARYQRAVREWQDVIQKVRRVPGREHFLVPLSYTSLRRAASEGPIVVLLPGEFESCAIIVTQNEAPLVMELVGCSVGELMYQMILQTAALESSDETIAESQIKDVLRYLWDVVVEQVVLVLREALSIPIGSRIWWHPLSAFSSFPLHAAGPYVIGEDNLSDIFVSSYTSSLKSLIRPKYPRRSTFGMAAPLLVSQTNSQGFAPLPHAKAEIRAINEIIPRNKRVIEDNLATRSVVLEKVRQHSWLHLACHGRADISEPLLSRFILHDGSISLLDMFETSGSPMDFAFLAACNSSPVDLTTLAEAHRLPSAAQLVGYKGAIGGLWPVWDADGALVAREFYKELMPGILNSSKAAQALHNVVNRMKRKGLSMKRWVGYVHYGL